MKRYITVVGVGKRMAGTGKASGKSYDFTPVSFTYDDPHISGVKACTVNINQADMGDYTPIVGDVLEVVMHEDFRTGKVYVDAIL